MCIWSASSSRTYFTRLLRATVHMSRCVPASPGRHEETRSGRLRAWVEVSCRSQCHRYEGRAHSTIWKALPTSGPEHAQRALSLRGLRHFSGQAAPGLARGVLVIVSSGGLDGAPPVSGFGLVGDVSAGERVARDSSLCFRRRPSRTTGPAWHATDRSMPIGTHRSRTPSTCATCRLVGRRGR
jgi:hypothetical protein